VDCAFRPILKMKTLRFGDRIVLRYQATNKANISQLGPICEGVLIFSVRMEIDSVPETKCFTF
jgi:hypothetical protein